MRDRQCQVSEPAAFQPPILTNGAQSEAVTVSIASKIATSHSPEIAVARPPTAHTQGCQNPTPNAHPMRDTHRDHSEPDADSRHPCADPAPQTPELPPESPPDSPPAPHAPATPHLTAARRLRTRVDHPRATGMAVALAEPPAPPTGRLPGLRPVAGALCLRRPTSGTLTPKSTRADQTSPRANRPCLDVHVLSAGAFWITLDDQTKKSARCPYPQAPHGAVMSCSRSLLRTRAARRPSNLLHQRHLNPPRLPPRPPPPRCQA